MEERVECPTSTSSRGEEDGMVVRLYDMAEEKDEFAEDGGDD